jgi:hypothetical protein
LDVQTVACDTSSNTCSIQVPAPGFALAFLSQDDDAPATVTFSTTSVTKMHNTVTVNPTVLATSNGHSGSSFQVGSTSPQSNGGGGGEKAGGVVVSGRLFVVVMLWILGLCIV